MVRVLVSGGSGFIAAHVLDDLLQRGHSVVTTVRSKAKGDKIKEAHSQYGDDKLSYVIVEDIAQEGAFNKAVISDPPFEAVIHTASPFHFNVTDTKKDLLDPAINGTTGILQAIKKSAPSVRRVVITSSFAAIVNAKAPGKYKYTEEDWNPVTLEESEKDASTGYRASKTFAEKAAWEFLEKEKPNFTIATINPPLVLGPIVHYLNSLDALNTSNQRIRDIYTGKQKDGLTATGVYLWVHVQDVSLAHVLAMEKEEAANKRFFVTAGHFSNKAIAEAVASGFPEYKDNLPTGDGLKSGDYPADGNIPYYDNTRSIELLGLTYRPFKDAVIDTVKSLQAVEK